MTAKPTKRNILIVDDHPIVRERLVEVISREADLAVCGEAETRLQTLQLAKKLKPDLVLLDLNLKDTQGTDLIKDLVAQNPEMVILVLSMHDESLFAERAIRAGARGYITKQEATKGMLAAIRKVLDGHIHLNDALTQRLFTKIIGGSTGPSMPSVEMLSDRELQVLRLLGRGLSTKQVGERLCLDTSTVDTYRSRIKDKLNLKDANELLAYAINWVRASGLE